MLLLGLALEVRFLRVLGCRTLAVHLLRWRGLRADGVRVLLLLRRILLLHLDRVRVLVVHWRRVLLHPGVLRVLLRSWVLTWCSFVSHYKGIVLAIVVQ